MREQTGRGEGGVGWRLGHLWHTSAVQWWPNCFLLHTDGRARKLSLWCCAPSYANSFGNACSFFNICCTSFPLYRCNLCQHPSSFNIESNGSDLAHWQVSVIQIQGRFRHVRLKAAPPSPRRLLWVNDDGHRWVAGHFARRVSCRDRRAGVWLWLGRGSRLMKCSLSHAKLRACAARDSSPPLWVAWWHGRYGRARDGGTRGAAVECGTPAVFLQQKKAGGHRKKQEMRKDSWDISKKTEIEFIWEEWKWVTDLELAPACRAWCSLSRVGTEGCRCWRM